MNGNNFKVAILFRRIGPYHQVRLKAMTGKFDSILAVESSGKDLINAYATVTQEPSLSWITLFPDTDAHFLESRLVNKKIYEVLTSSGVDVVVIHGWIGNSALAALQWCRLNRVPAVVVSDSQEIDRPRNFFKEFFKSRLLRNFSSALCGGKPHIDYLVKLGMLKSNIFTGCDAIDNEYFRSGAYAIREKASDYRESLDLPDNYFLTSCRFITEKNIQRLIKAYALYKNKAKESYWKLVLLGDGELRPDILQTIANCEVNDDIILPGFIQYPGLPIYYALASCFILSSISESWGLVINEAMASGLPVLVSDRCGCSKDLVKPGQNGFTFNPLDLEEIADLMHLISQKEINRTEMGRQSEIIIENWSPSNFADNLEKAVHIAANTPQPPLGIFDKILLHGLSRG